MALGLFYVMGLWIGVNKMANWPVLQNNVDLADATQQNLLQTEKLDRDGQIPATGVQQWKKGADVASAATLVLGNDGNYFDVTGAVGITAISQTAVGGAAVQSGTVIKLHFDAYVGPIITHHATNLILPYGVNVATIGGDEAEFTKYENGWRCTNYEGQGLNLANSPSFKKITAGYSGGGDGIIEIVGDTDGSLRLAKLDISEATEVYIITSARDDSNVGRKIGVLAFKFADIDHLSGFGSWNIHATKLTAGVAADEFGIAGWGRNGVAVFPPGVEKTYAPGDKIFKIFGNIMVNGGQIEFPAVQVPSANENTLDDYEEGTWTPVRHDFTEVIGGGSITNAGYYTKIGRMVITTATITCAGGATIAAVAGTSYLTGMPFAPAIPVSGTWVHTSASFASGGGIILHDGAYMIISTAWAAGVAVISMTAISWI